MLTITRLTKGSVGYYKRLARYLRGKFGPGDDDGDEPDPDLFGGSSAEPITTRNAFTSWVGGAAKYFGIEGHPVVNSHFERLCQGLHPITKEPLVQNAKSSKRCPGWDFTFSVPKSVSMAWAGGTPLIKAIIIEALDEAVKETLEKLEEELVYCRVGTAGKDRRLEKAKIAVATWRDYINRELEPQLHVHATLINVGLLGYSDAKFNALHSTTFYPSKKVLGAWFRNSVAKKLIQKGGVIEQDGTSFQLVGVAQELCQQNSTRRRQVLDGCRDEGHYNPLLAQQVSSTTRKAKENVPPLAVLEQRYLDECAEFGFLPEDAEELFNGKPLPTRLSTYEIVAEAEKELLEKNTVFTAKQLLFQSLVKATPYAYESQAIEDAVAQRLEIEPHLIPLAEQTFTTQEQLDTEHRLLKTYDKLRQKPGARVPFQEVLTAMRSNPNASSEQQAAIHSLLCNPGSVRILEGVAGSGKTSSVLLAVADALHRSGFEVKALAPTGRAATELRNALDDVEAKTIASGLGLWKREPWELPVHVMLGITKEAMRVLPFLPSVPHWKLRRPKVLDINKKTVLIVDEASAVNIEEHQKLFDAVRKNGGTVILCGDPKQLAPVKGTSPFPLFVRFEKGTAAVLAAPMRQAVDWQRDCVKLARNGDPKAFEMLRNHGCISVSQTVYERQATLLADWTQFGIHEPHKSAIIADTNLEIEQLNQECQRLRIEAGAIDDSGPSLAIRDEKTGIATTVYQGDRVLFTANVGMESKAVKTGFAGTLEFVSRSAPSSVRLDSGELIELSRQHRENMRLGYATSDYRSQGGSFDNVYVVPGQSAESIFVSVSRHRERLKVFTTSQEVPDFDDIANSPLAATLAETNLGLAVEHIWERANPYAEKFTPDVTRKAKKEPAAESVSDEPVRTESKTATETAAENHQPDPTTPRDTPKSWYEEHHERFVLRKKKGQRRPDVIYRQERKASEESYTPTVTRKAKPMSTAKREIENAEKFGSNKSTANETKPSPRYCERVKTRRKNGEERPTRILMPGGPKQKRKVLKSTLAWLRKDLNVVFEEMKHSLVAFSKASTTFTVKALVTGWTHFWSSPVREPHYQFHSRPTHSYTQSTFTPCYVHETDRSSRTPTWQQNAYSAISTPQVPITPSNTCSQHYSPPRSSASEPIHNVNDSLWSSPLSSTGPAPASSGHSSPFGQPNAYCVNGKWSTSNYPASSGTGYRVRTVERSVKEEVSFAVEPSKKTSQSQ